MDIPDDIYYELQLIEYSDYDSDSEDKLEDSMGDDEESYKKRREDNEIQILTYYIWKNGDTIWANTFLSQTIKTKVVNIIKTIPGPKGEARKCKTRLECFL